MNVPDRKYFGTDGIRGVAGEPPLDPVSLVRVGQAIAEVFLRDSRKHRILIGKDTRLSGYMIETALASGISSSGADVILVGPCPTPGVAYLTKSMRADAGIMISASHNPYEDNGIKIFGADGFKLPDEQELEIERLAFMSEDKETPVAAKQIGKATRIDDASGRYIVFLKSAFPREFDLDGLKIGFDCGNGAAYQVAPKVCLELGAELVSRGVSPNGRNINAGFGSLYPEVVRKLVLEHNLDIGIALDGDADRCILVDEKGEVHDGDTVLAICALSLKERGELPGNTVVTTVMSNLGLHKALQEAGIKVLQTAVGDRYVLEKMIESGAVLGGEQSGHTIFANNSTTGDGTLTALKVLEVMRLTQKPLSELAACFEKYPQTLINIPVREKPELGSVEAIASIIEETERKLGDDGRILVRYSGTENKARVMVEYSDKKECKKYAQGIADVIKNEIGAV